uniref:Estrogen receptor (Fragments) n=1 Tax=Bos taurus TaxID=9913 RepID=Q7M2M5_BOVIN
YLENESSGYAVREAGPPAYYRPNSDNAANLWPSPIMIKELVHMINWAKLHAPANFGSAPPEDVNITGEAENFP